MEKYDYREAMVKDIKQYINDNYMQPEPDMSREEYVEKLNDELWDVDEITGNGPYYYASEEECAGYVGYGLSDLVDALEEFGFEMTSQMKERFTGSPACYMDCTIRCYLLYECIERAVDELGYFEEVD